MSFEIPQQAKYRLTGGLIMVSFAIFVLPGLMEKSNQRFEESIAKHTAVPPKPKAPRLAIPSRQEAFANLQAASAVPEPKIAERVIDIQLSKAEPLVLSQELIKPQVEVKSMPKQEKMLDVEPAKPKIAQNNLPNPEKNAQSPFALQLASFSQQENALFLIKRLKKMGYSAQVFKIPSQNGGLYQVVVGHLENKENAISLQKKLADNLQLQGLIIHKELG
jgi:DedD protein